MHMAGMQKKHMEMEKRRMDRHGRSERAPGVLPFVVGMCTIIPHVTGRLILAASTVIVLSSV